MKKMSQGESIACNKSTNESTTNEKKGKID